MSARNLTNKQLLAAMQHATGFVWSIPNAPSQMVAVQTNLMSSGRWGVFRHGVDDRSVWNGDAWVTAHQAARDGLDLYGLDLQDALRAVPALVEQLDADHRAWQQRHNEAAELGEQIDEWLEPINDAETREEIAA